MVGCLRCRHISLRAAGLPPIGKEDFNATVRNRERVLLRVATLDVPINRGGVFGRNRDYYHQRRQDRKDNYERTAGLFTMTGLFSLVGSEAGSKGNLSVE